MVAACGIRNRTLPRSLWLTRRERFATVAAVCTLVLGAWSAAPTPTSAPTEPVTGSQITPLLDTTLSTPRWFTGTDGQAHLVYELLLTNVIPALVTLHSVEVHDSDSGATLTRLTGDSLRAATSLAASAETPTVQLPPSSVAVVWLDVPLAATVVPAAITHRIAIDPPADVPLPPTALTFAGTTAQVDRRPPNVIGPPLAGPRWAALGSCCDGPHRRAPYPIDGRWYLGQRFAIDFNQLDFENRPGVGDPLLPPASPRSASRSTRWPTAPSSSRSTATPTCE